MSRGELRRLLLGAKHLEPAERRELVARASANASAPWFDLELHRQFASLAAHFGESFPARAFVPLAPGETWLMLADERAQGDVVRARAQSRREHADGLAQAPREVDRAIRGLEVALRGAGSMLPGSWADVVFSVPADDRLRIDGSSLGIAVSVALLSAATGVAPRSDTAGTAAVDADGRLRGITRLAEKCEALRSQWPEVTRIVVADEQEDCPLPAELTLLRSHSVSEAVGYFGLDLTKLKPTVGDLRKRIAALHTAEELTHSSAEWVQLSNEARRIGLHLEHLGLSEWREAIILSALLASHAGDNRRALEILDEHDFTRASPVVFARRAIYRASIEIEADPPAAIGRAHEAIALVDALPRGDEYARLHGRAQGTAGRALTFAARPREAIEYLRRGFEHHATHEPHEAARSACYLACGLRMAGHIDEALRVANEAVDLSAEHDAFEVSQTSRLFALLERGRALLCLGRWVEAAADLREVAGASRFEESYPALGARRSLVEALRAADKVEEAGAQLDVCLRVANGGARITVRRVGAVGAAAELLAARAQCRAPLRPGGDLEAVWRRCFDDADPETTMRSWVY